MIVAQQEIRQLRIEVCKSCKSIGKIPLTNFAKCNVCNCPIGTKTYFAASACPQNKWMPVQTAKEDEAT